MSQTRFAVLGALATSIATLTVAQAAPGMRQAGTLTCAMAPGVGLVLGSSRDVDCVYRHYDRRGRTVQESYAGRMDRAGIDLGVTSNQVVSWAVMTPGGANRRGMLASVFSGSSADATLMVGAGTRSLFDQVGRPVALTPMGGSGQIGLGIGFGEAALDLRRTPDATYTSFAR